MLVRDAFDKIIGVSTAVAMEDEMDDVTKVFIEAGYALEEMVYFGESVLLKEHRGKGIGKEFFKMREEFTHVTLKRNLASFCGVVRDHNDPRKPEGYRDLEGFWEIRDFKKMALVGEMSWQDIGEEKETKKQMQYWMKSWSAQSEK